MRCFCALLCVCVLAYVPHCNPVVCFPACFCFVTTYVPHCRALDKKEGTKEERERKKKVEWKERKRASQQNETHAAGTAQSAAADAPRANPLRQPGASARGPKVENRTHPKNRLQPPRRLQRARQQREMMQQRRDQRRRYGQCLAQQGQEVEEGEEAEKEELCG